MRKINIVVSLLTMGTVGFISKVFNRLPDQIPRQWGLDGSVNSYMGREWIFLLALLPIVLLLLFNILPKVDPRKDNYKLHDSSYHIIILSISILLIVVTNITVAKSLGLNIDIKIVVISLVGILMIIIGNLMPRIRPNYFLGIRTPWTLANSDVWTKTHRVGGWSFIILGLSFIIAAFLPVTASLVVTLTALVSMVLWPVIYSYKLYKRLK